MSTSPFKFLDSYTREDRKIFFGRDREITELYRRVFESKILLVYGISGTGKSSLINCGLASRFDDSDWLPINVRRGTNIVESINEAFLKQSISPLKENLSISEKLKSIYLDHFKPVYLIFDQFEELFIFGNEEEKRGFIDLIKEIVDSETQCKVIFVIREEFLAGITEFEYDLPEIFANRFRVEKMKRANAILAIEGPCKVHNIETEPGFSEELIDKLCPAGSEIELTYLQIYLDRILRLATTQFPPCQGGQGGANVPSQGGTKGVVLFSKSLLSKAGNVSDLLGQFLEEQIREIDDPDTGMAILKSFVSAQGTKKQMTEPEILDSIGAFGTVLSHEALLKYLEKFVDLRILRERDESGHFELRHDALAEKIYENFTAIEKDIIEVRQFIDTAFSVYERRGKLLNTDDLKYIAPYEDKLFLSKSSEVFIERSKYDILRSKRRRRNIVSIAALALIIVLSGFTLWALNERKVAYNERQNAYQNYLKARGSSFNFLSQKVVESDPTIALRINEFALSLDSVNPNIINNLYKIYSENIFYRIISQHKRSIEAAIFSPDGNWILTGSYDQTACLWDLQGNLLQVFKGHEGAITSVAFSPDGKNILTGSNDKTARLWDLNGNMLTIFKGHENYVYSVSFSPNGKNILTGSWDKTARLWNLQGDVLHIFKGHGDLVYSVAFSPKGNTILTGSWDKTARLWDLQGKILQIFKGHESVISSAAFSPDGKSILTGSHDKTARLWDIQGNVLQVFKGQKERITSVAFSPDSKSILTGSFDKIVRQWDLKGNILKEAKGHEGIISSVTFSPDGKKILTSAEDRTARLWDLRENVLSVLNKHESELSSVAFSHDNQKILTGSFDRTARLWDLQGNVLLVLTGHEGRVSSVAFSNDDQKILTGSSDKTARLWDVHGKLLQVFKGHNDNVISAVFSPDGKKVLTGSIDKTARLWDLNGNVLQVFRGHTEGITKIAFSPSGDKILTSSLEDFTARLWNLQGKSLFAYYVQFITSIAFSPDGNLILTGSFDGSFRLWDLHGNLLHVFKGHDLNITSIAFSPDGKSILTGSFDNTARLWNLKGNLLELFNGHEDYVTSAVFSPDGKSILTGSYDKTARLWAVKKTLEEFQKENDYQALSMAQKIKYDVLEFSDLLNLNDEKSIYEAAEYYNEAIIFAGKDEKTENIKNSIKLFGKLVQINRDPKYLLKFVDVYEFFQGINPNDETEKIIDNLNNELISINNPDIILNRAGYFLSKGSTTTEKEVSISYYQKSVLLFEKILKEFPEKDIKQNASVAFNNLSLSLLFTRQYKEALKYAKRGIEVKNDDDILYTKLALAYLFNDQYEESLQVIVNHEKNMVNNVRFQEYVLAKLNELENAGVTNDNSKRMKEAIKNMN